MTEKKNIIISKSDDPSFPDRAAKDAVSRWLENDSVRMRVVTYPPGYEGDHVCYLGHAIYVISGIFRMEVEESLLEWQESDAFIIPDDVPHRPTISGKSEVKVVIFDHHT